MSHVDFKKWRVAVLDLGVKGPVGGTWRWRETMGLCV